MEYGTNRILADISIHQLEIIRDELTVRITKGLLLPEESSAYTKLSDSIFAVAAGAVVACPRGRRETGRLTALKDEIDTVISWNIAWPVHQHLGC